ncbi:ChaN family lipoprotein [Magnetospirillum sp. UT-4]|uniref:ChaN family lipoprotein n=1 Tax=Magnetospirillum sp. UT-4 TaxID=2681467 RepID=UPI00137F7146|nr:ChaN family lipoprotein [Magnetospirillum sp. UT-4]CAA7623160.1 conserved exported hypothetical protein [Magnetospirillum sp. UT-4]
MRVLMVLAFLLAALPAAAEPPPPLTAPLDQGHPLVGRIWLPDRAMFTTADEVVERMRRADAVLLGETHDNADHHALQAWALRRLVAADRRPLVAFEMIDTSQGEALAAHLAARPADTAGLGAALGWDKSGWPDWTLYRPIAEAALAAGGMAPANLSREDTRAIAKGNVPTALAGRLGLEQPVEAGLRQAMEAEIRSGHCDMLPDRALPAMVRVQRARDAMMARAVADGLAARGSAVLIAGTGHARADRGVPLHLAAMAPGRGTFVLAFLEVQEGRTEPAAYAELYDADRLPFDAAWFTPRAERPDPCEGFRKHMEKKAEK